MIRILPPERWGNVNIGWLNAKHLYSFGSYYDPFRMGFGPLRVVNHDVVAAGKGFDLHPHNNMEIITIILEGELRHADLHDNHGVIRTGDAQHMSAGTGIVHTEINASDAPTRLFQIWIEPAEYHIEPSYSQRSFDRTQKRTIIASPDGRENSLLIRQNATITHYHLEQGETYHYQGEQPACLLIGDGSVDLNDKALVTGTAIEIDAKEQLQPLTALETTNLYEITWSE